MIFDRTHFTAMTGGDAALQAEVLSLFRTQAAIWLDTLNVSDGWRETVHTAKGSARGIGFWALAAACEQAEAADNAAAPEALARVRAALAEALEHSAA